MDHKDSEDVLEAGEDGVFDLGDPSPPPSPVKVEDKSAADKMAPSTRSPTPHVEQDVKEGNPKPAAPASTSDNAGEIKNPMNSGSECAGSLVSEEFIDAVEPLQAEPSAEVPDKTAEGSVEPEAEKAKPGAGALEEPNLGFSGVTPGLPAKNVPPAEPPETAEKPQMSYISAGLANVRLPMPRQRWKLDAVISEVEAEDTDGEGEFHDAYDTVAGLVKDAAKALEMKEAGNGHYKNEEFDEAADYYSMALEYCPEDEDHKQDRAVCLGNRAACHLQLKEFEAVVDDCTAALELNPRYVKALLRRAQANESLEKYDMALEDMKTLLEIDPNMKVARKGAPRLEKLHTEKMEKMKDEAIGKLKELGNSLLGHFGLSTDNFKMQQDPNTGSYSINFEK